MEQKEIADRIMGLLFPGDSINICQRDRRSTIRRPRSRRQLLQLKSWRTANNSFEYKRSSREATHFASQHPESLDHARLITRRPANGEPFCDFSLNILLVSKTFHKLGLKHMWARNFRFQCSARGTKDFLLEHPLYARSTTQLDLFYHFGREPGVIETNDYEWHDLTNKVRHHFSCIPKIHIHIGHGFWHKDDWRMGAEPVMDERSSRRRPNFLDDVAKTAAPAERWQDHDDPTTLRIAGTEVRVSIEYTGKEGLDEKKEKVKFVEELTEEILKRGLARPLFDEPVPEESQRAPLPIPPAWTRLPMNQSPRPVCHRTQRGDLAAANGSSFVCPGEDAQR